MDKFFQNSGYRKGALLVYWVVLTNLLFRPAQLQQDQWFIFPNIDKVVHLTFFALLSFLFCFAFPRLKFVYFIQILLIYGVSTEIIQEMMNAGRSMEVLDVVADSLGILLGYYIYKILAKVSSVKM